MPELLHPPTDAFPPLVGDAVRSAAADFFKSCRLQYQEQAEAEDVASAGFMSTISFVGEPRWSFSLILPDRTAVALARAFAGFEIPVTSPDMGDVIGEVVNVIAGGICAYLDARGRKAQMSLPMVVRGENVSVLVPSGALTKRMGFTGPNGGCWCQLVQARVSGVVGRQPGE